MKNTITSLRQGTEQYGAEPVAWEISRDFDGIYRLRFTHENIGSGGTWEYIVTRDGKHKTYKTIDAAFGDIHRITTRTTIYYEG